MVALAQSPVDPAPSALEDLPTGSAREQLIVQIRLMNPGASRGLLEGFDDGALVNYLRHLRLAQSPRSTAPVWVRLGETRGITRLVPDTDR